MNEECGIEVDGSLQANGDDNLGKAEKQEECSQESLHKLSM